MSDTSIRVTAAALSLKRFTVAQLCEYTGLRRSQVDPVLGELKKEGFLTQAAAPEPAGTARSNHRPVGIYETIGDRTRLQGLIDRVYRLRRAMGTDERIDSADLTAIDVRLHGLDLSLEASLTASEARPLSRGLLERVEDELRAIHGLLESATYRRALNIQSEEHREHPVVAAWERWQACEARLHQIVDQWEQPLNKGRLFSIISPRMYTVKRLQIVCDPRFIDSALFLWMFSQQPFREVGVDIECAPVLSNWADIPKTVAANEHAIGFFNREEGIGDPSYDVGYWIDLCVYRGYALLAHPSFKLRRPATLTDSQELLKRLHNQIRFDGGTPTVISIGHDTVWRFGSQLTPEVPRIWFEWEIERDANKALEMFLSREGTFFVGGLPQRLSAEKAGAVPILDAKHKPSLFSINGIVFNPALGLGGQAVLQDVASMWFDIVKRLGDREYRHETAAAIRKMLAQLHVHDSLVFGDEMFDRMFEEKLEQFPTSPAEMTSLYAAVLKEALLSEKIRSDIVIDSTRQAQGGFGAELHDRRPAVH